MKLHQANFLYLFHPVYHLSKILHILLHLYGYILHIHVLYHLTILLHIHPHLNELIFLLYSLYHLPNNLHTYFHLSILVFPYHVFLCHFFPILHNKLLDFHILHFVLIVLKHHLLKADIFQILFSDLHLKLGSFEYIRNLYLIY